MLNEKENKNPNGLRVIRTARDVDSINEAARNGYKPLIKKVDPSEEIHTKYSVVQNKETGEILKLGDYRSDFSEEEDYEIVIGWTLYYPYKYDLPFAAHLIPKDIKIGERVFIEDLIEDYIGRTWNQGDVFRLQAC